MHRQPKQLSNLYQEIILEPGYYIISPEETFFEKEYLNLKKQGLIDIQQIRLNLLVRYGWPYSTNTVFEGTLKEALKWLQKKLTIGLSLGQEVVYSVRSDKELFKALSLTINNRQNTVIRILKCTKYPCITNKKWLEKIYSLNMDSNDGMRLRISSRFSSLDQDKWAFFRNKLKPFLEGY
tara:strand:+ start:1261 stop:1800 length:540 start_codon:yes stop_codon:yes gene_type:complete